MAEIVERREAFHVARTLIYNNNSPMAAGAKLRVGGSVNPFFGFYQNSRTYPVDTPQGRINCKAIKFLNSVRDGQINCPNLPQIAAEVAQHYVMLSRELIMEEVRKEIAPDAPSRQLCVWLAQDLSEAQHWATRLGNQGVIFRVSLSGSVHRADAGFLLGDSEPINVTYDRAKKYWQGENSDTPEMETLFVGELEVLEALDG